jgi:hypothetical protein
MLRRQTQNLDQARAALQEHWPVVEAGEQVEIQLEVGRVVGAILVLVVLFGTPDVLKVCQYQMHKLLVYQMSIMLLAFNLLVTRVAEYRSAWFTSRDERGDPSTVGEYIFELRVDLRVCNELWFGLPLGTGGGAPRSSDSEARGKGSGFTSSTSGTTSAGLCPETGCNSGSRSFSTERLGSSFCGLCTRCMPGMGIIGIL